MQNYVPAWHRREACEKLGIECTTVPWDLQKLFEDQSSSVVVNDLDLDLDEL